VAPRTLPTLRRQPAAAPGLNFPFSRQRFQYRLDRFADVDGCVKSSRATLSASSHPPPTESCAATLWPATEPGAFGVRGSMNLHRRDGRRAVGHSRAESGTMPDLSLLQRVLIAVATTRGERTLSARGR
jgi:hypothetical protein